MVSTYAIVYAIVWVCMVHAVCTPVCIVQYNIYLTLGQGNQ